MILKNRRVIFLALVLVLTSDVATTYVFNTAAEFTAVQRQKITKIIDQTNHEIQNVTSPASVRVVEGVNGSKEVFVTASLVVNVQLEISGQILSNYMARLAFWETLERLFELARDYNERMSEAFVCAFCFLLLLGQLKKAFFSPRALAVVNFNTRNSAVVYHRAYI